MGIKRFRGLIIFECDECGEEIETNESDFQAAINVFRNDPEGEKWESNQDGKGSWSNYCPDCKEEM